MTKEGNQFYVFKHVDDAKDDVRAEDVRLERSYGLRRKAKASGEIDYPIMECDLGKSMDELLAESGMRIDIKPRALTARESEATWAVRKELKKERRRAKAIQRAKHNETMAAKRLASSTCISGKTGQQMEVEAKHAAALEKKWKGYRPGFNEFLEKKRMSRIAVAQNRRIAEEKSVVEGAARRAAHREGVAARRGGLRSGAGTRSGEAPGPIDLAKDVGPVKDDGSEDSAIWSFCDDDESEETLPTNQPAKVHLIAQHEEDELDELDELDDGDMAGPTSAHSLTPATEAFSQTPLNVEDLLDEETISLILEAQDELVYDSSEEEQPMPNGPGRIATSETHDTDVDAHIPSIPAHPEPSNRGESNIPQRRMSSPVIPDWRVYTQEELGLPRLGLAMPRKGFTAMQDYTGPSGRQLHFEREWNANKEHHVKRTCYSWPQLSNSAGTAILSPTSAADVFHEVQAYCRGPLTVQDGDPEVLGARGARRLWVDLPAHLIAGPIVSDSGNKGKRGLEILHFTFAAALYMAGWLDHGFNFSYTRPTLENGNVRPSSIATRSPGPQAPVNDVLKGNPASLPSANAGNAGSLSNTQSHPIAGSHFRSIKGLPANISNLVSIEPKTPKLWTMRKINAPGAYCAIVCRIKDPGGVRRFRTVCILTTDRLNIPLGRSLPTCRVLPGIEAILATGQDVLLDKRQWEEAHDYTLALFSIPRRRQLYAVRGQLPYYILPMHSGWQTADEATSEVKSKETVNVSSNIAWTEVSTRNSHITRMLSGHETSGQLLDSLSSEALYQVNGSGMPYEVTRIARDADSREKALSRAGLPDNTRLAIVDGPAFVLNPLPDLWTSGLRSSVGASRCESLCMIP